MLCDICQKYKAYTGSGRYFGLCARCIHPDGWMLMKISLSPHGQEVRHYVNTITEESRIVTVSQISL